MSMTNPLAAALEALKEGSRLDGGAEALYALIAEIPIGGGAISSLLTGRAQRKMVERVTEVFEAFKERMERVDEKKVDRAFFESNEFLTLFTLTLEQIQTTHDKAKLKMLAAGLANSATFEFATESRKELFLRILRDLAPEHVSMLNKLRLPGEYGRKDVRMPFNSPKGDSLTVLQHLTSQGLVTENLRVEKTPTVNFSHPGAYNMIQKYLETPPSKSYVLSDFGVQFLHFFENETAESKGAATSKDSDA